MYCKNGQWKIEARKDYNKVLISVKPGSPGLDY